MLTRWNDRTCTCRHGKAMHPERCGWTRCIALRCDCPIFDAVWAARFWAWFNRPLFTKEKP